MNLTRLLSPRSVAFVGGQWADIAARQCRALGFAGEVWQVNPRRAAAGEAGFAHSLADLPVPPDSTFLAVPREKAGDLAGDLNRAGAGGAVCFAAGFNETGSTEGRCLLDTLLTAADDMPVLGPNCYGFINYFDRVALWPDEIAPALVERGVGFISQSGTIAITMSHNQRALPLGYVVSAGNQAMVSIEDLMLHMADDPRITALGLYLEGVRDAERFVRTLEKVRDMGKPVALIKAGRTDAARQAALTHTGSMTGSDAVFDALCARLGVARCDTLAQLCETLKILHVSGPLAGNRVLVLGASGGDMAMTSDLAARTGLDLAPLPGPAEDALRALYGDRLVYSNPFDANTYSWYDHDALAAQFRALCTAGYDCVVYVLDTPDPAHCDPAAFEAAIRIFVRECRAARQTACMLSSLPELTPAGIRALVIEAGATPLQGLPEGLFALDAASRIGAAWGRSEPVRLLSGSPNGRVLAEAEGKNRLAEAGIPVPEGRTCPPEAAVDIAKTLSFPLVLKTAAAELAHKTEAGGVALGLRDEAAVASAAKKLGDLADRVLIERMIEDGVAEILIGVERDGQFGLTLTLASGGTLTELIRDPVLLLFPVSAPAVRDALARLTVWPLLNGFRGRPAADVEALVEAVLRIAGFAESLAPALAALEINPLIVRPAGRGVVAADCLMTLLEET